MLLLCIAISLSWLTVACHVAILTLPDRQAEVTVKAHVDSPCV